MSKYIRQAGNESFLVLPESKYSFNLRAIEKFILTTTGDEEEEREAIRIDTLLEGVYYIGCGDPTCVLNESQDFIEWVKETFLSIEVS